MGLWQTLFGSKNPSKQQARERALAWWQQNGKTSAKCDICANEVSANEGYLLHSAEVLQSDNYIDFCCQKMAEGVTRSAGSLGIDPTVFGAAKAAEITLILNSAVAGRDQVIAKIKSQTTPWLVCETCLSRRFPKIAATV